MKRNSPNCSKKKCKHVAVGQLTFGLMIEFKGCLSLSAVKATAELACGGISCQGKFPCLQIATIAQNANRKYLTFAIKLPQALAKVRRP